MKNLLEIKDADDTKSFIQDTWMKRHTYKYGLERQWYLNIAWFAGFQNTIWAEDLRRLIEPTMPSWRVRLIINLIQPIIRTLQAKLYRPRLEWDVIPATTDEADIQLSNVDKQILEYLWKSNKMDTAALNHIEWLTQTGNAFFKVYWDPTKGPKLKINPEDLVGEEVDVNDPKIKAVTKRYNELLDKQLKIGDVCFDVKSPFDILPDPLATSMDDAMYILDSTLKYKDEVKSEWGSKAIDIGDDNKTFITSTQQLNLHSKVNRLQNRYGLPSDQGNDMIMVHELWFKPDRIKGIFKNGRHVIICGSKTLKYEEFPYNHGLLPYIHTKEIDVKGTFWGTSTLEQMIGIQADFNKNRSQLVEIRNLMSKPKWTAAKNSGIAANAITSEPGEVILHNHGMEPKPVQMPNVPSYVIDIVNMYRQDLEDISGQHEVSRAEAPGQVRSGRGILALIEQDETRLAPVLEKLDDTHGRCGRQALMLMCQFAKEDRIARYVDNNDQLVLTGFSGSQLMGRNYGRPGVDYFDVRVSTIPGMPNSRSAQLALIDSLLERQVLNPQTDRPKIFRLLNIGKVDRIIDDTRSHRSRAMYENKLMSEGNQIEAKTYQNHEAHLDVLHTFMNSPEYDALDPQVQNIFLVHEQMHKEMAAMLAVEPQVLMQNAMLKMGMIPNEGQKQQGNGKESERKSGGQQQQQ